MRFCALRRTASILQPSSVELGGEPSGDSVVEDVGCSSRMRPRMDPDAPLSIAAVFHVHCDLSVMELYRLINPHLTGHTPMSSNRQSQSRSNTTTTETCVNYYIGDDAKHIMISICADR